MKSNRVIDAGWMVGAIVITAMLVLAGVSSCTAQPTMRYEVVASGPMISSNAVQTESVAVTFKLGLFKATGGGHLVIGRGDLERYFAKGKPPLGTGVIIGEAAGCQQPGQISILMEDWYETVSVNDYSTCVNGLKAERVYTVTLRRDGYSLWEEDALIASVLRPAVQRDVAGVFLFGAESTTPYTLIKYSTTAKPVVELFKER